MLRTFCGLFGLFLALLVLNAGLLSFWFHQREGALNQQNLGQTPEHCLILGQTTSLPLPWSTSTITPGNRSFETDLHRLFFLIVQAESPHPRSSPNYRTLPFNLLVERKQSRAKYGHDQSEHGRRDACSCMKAVEPEK
jgi:hypothetical protein